MSEKRPVFIKNRFVRVGLSVAALRFASTFLTIAVSIFLARLIGPEGMGHYAFAMSLVTLAGIPTQMGIPILVLRETAQAEEQGNWARMRGIWNWAARRILVGTAILIPSIAFVSWFLKGSILTSDGAMTIWAALPMLFFFAAGQLRTSALRGLSQPALAMFPDSILRPVIQLIGLGVLAYFLQEPSSYMAVLINVGGALLAFLLGSLFVYRTAPTETWTSKPDQTLAPEWKKAILPLALVSGAYVVIQNLNIMVLGIFHSPEETGLFRIALSASTMITFGMTVINFVVTPSFAKLHVDMPREKLARTAQMSSALSVVAAVPVALIFIFGGGNLLTLLYGEAYQGAYGALAVLAISKLVLAAYGSCGNLLNMTGHERDVVRALVLGLIVNCVMSLTLVPALGGLGAALATLAGTLVWNIQLSRKVAEKLGFSGTFFPVIFSFLRRK